MAATNYGKTNLNRMRDRQKELQSRLGKNWFKAAEGENRLRIAPPWKGSDVPFKEVERHKAKIRGKDTFYTCSLSVGLRECPTCNDAIPMLQAEIADRDSDEAQDILESLAPSLTIFANVLDRTSPEKEAKGWQVWGFSQTRYNEILSFLNDQDYGDITDPESGTDIVLVRRGTGFSDTKYNTYAKRKSSPVPRALLDKIPNLDEMMGPMTPDEEKKLLFEAYGLTFDGETERQVSTPARDRAPARDDDRDDRTVRDTGRDDNPPQEEDQGGGGEAPADQGEPLTDGKRTAIFLPEGLKLGEKRAAIEREAKDSECFGVLFNDTSEICESCSAVVDCAVKTPRGDAAPAERAAPRRIATPAPRQTSRSSTSRPAGRPAASSKPAGRAPASRRTPAGRRR